MAYLPAVVWEMKIIFGFMQFPNFLQIRIEKQTNLE